MEKIALGVCSSISIYKSCEIIRIFQKKEFQIQVVMTGNAARLISPVLFRAITGHDIFIDLFHEEASKKIPHIALAKEISLLLIAPATANMVGKLAAGVADDFLSTLYTAVKCPVLIAPAMNEGMYLHRQTQENIRKLKVFGVKFVEPEKGYLACKDKGWGRLASPEIIVEEGLKLLKRSRSLKSRTVLVTAGSTREFLDPVRFLSNRSSGKMGYEIAEEALRRGAEVILISGPGSLIPPPGAEFIRIQNADEMEEKVVKHFDKVDIVIMAAAVSDFKFAERASQKIKKQSLLNEVKLTRTRDILEKLGKRKGNKVLIGFAAETENIADNARKKMKQKNLDLIVTNDVSKEDIGFESDFNQVGIIFPNGRTIHTEKKSKFEISQIILDEIEGIIGNKN
ncbi:MAG: bifunctional phosphopantothenoylcysteine decarboxylase/phosphopantothenate--cysteine ligase CoaBC [Acidobacteriota bacterium]|nr:bifunctional phosphopantothenoylcysteine decarboxylase/phosphopantothenate--cysteine ligase CoaBC [Acidobacteriota bacterium]